MRAKLVNLNHCAVPFLSRAAVNLCWYYYIPQSYLLSTPQTDRVDVPMRQRENSNVISLHTICMHSQVVTLK